MSFIEYAISQTLRQSGVGYTPSSHLDAGGQQRYVDFLDFEGEYVITAELPGVKEKGIRIDASEREIRLRVGVLEGKSRHGGFSKTYAFAEKINPEKINAKYRNGFLEVKAPKKNLEKRIE